jgi:crotonobetainyl-CoA:carnitine CoA-transferase CaiB-like acyl-CoA transferase
MKIDVDTIRARFPKLIYATGSALGQNGPESDKGGYDAITFWSRGGISASLTEENADQPVSLPGPAFGDSLSGATLAGGICAAIAKRAMTGEASTVDVSLLGTAMWAQQRSITQSTDEGILRFQRPEKDKPNNVLVHNYKTKDGRFLALCMLQADKYWAKLCHIAGRPDLADDPRFLDADLRRANVDACVAELKALFASKLLAEWREILSQQDGQWDVVQYVGELSKDQQVQANRYIQPVTVTKGRTIQVVSVPMQFDGAPLPARPSPDLGADSEAILTDLGYDEDGIINLKIAGVVF